VQPNDTAAIHELNDAELAAVSGGLVNDAVSGAIAGALETEGRNYTPAEYSAWLEEAGFRHIETVWFDAPAANGAVIGRKP
jgi:3-hydroxy-5-methyl-1-naphthoate 3-O-methyltransferase